MKATPEYLITETCKKQSEMPKAKNLNPKCRKLKAESKSETAKAEI